MRCTTATDGHCHVANWLTGTQQENSREAGSTCVRTGGVLCQERDKPLRTDDKNILQHISSPSGMPCWKISSCWKIYDLEQAWPPNFLVLWFWMWLDAFVWVSTFINAWIPLKFGIGIQKYTCHPLWQDPHVTQRMVQVASSYTDISAICVSPIVNEFHLNITGSNHNRAWDVHVSPTFSSAKFGQGSSQGRCMRSTRFAKHVQSCGTLNCPLTWAVTSKPTAATPQWWAVTTM